MKTLGSSHSAAAAQVLHVLVFPGYDIGDSRDGPGAFGVDALDARIRIRAPQKLGVEHVWNDIVDAEFCYAGCLCPGQDSWKIGFPDDLEIFSGSIRSG
jgi:hypothetical protein